MSRDFPESDWKVLREVRELALQRFCERVLAEAQEAATDASKSAHERYVDLHRLIEERDRELGDTFDNPRRSMATMQLLAIHSRGLLQPEDLSRFTAATREAVSRLAGRGGT